MNKSINLVRELLNTFTEKINKEIIKKENKI